jgi:hypothetical protein
MKNSVRLFILSFLVLSGMDVWAQLTIKPLERGGHQHKTSNLPSKQYKKGKPDTLNLPFFDDFLYGPAFPDTARWREKQAFVNNDFALLPPSYGVVTLDPMDGEGNPWFPFSVFGSGPGDTLSSQPINLQDSGGVAYQIKDSIYLSFFYQSKGLADFSKNLDSLFLQFKNQFGNWITVWRAPGGNMTAFKQVMIPVLSAAHLHNSFQFRFTTYTYLWGNNNHFHLDYIDLRKNRRFNQTFYDDYAVSSPPTSLLKDYSAMPYQHFLTNPAANTADSIFFRVSNLTAGVLNIEVKHKETFQGNTLIETNPVTNAANVAAMGFAERRFQGFPLTGLSGDKVVIKRVYELREPSVLNPYRDNDRIETDFIFDNYYAYDDGTAEAGFGFNDLLKGEGSIAVKYEIAKSDTLRALGVFFNQSVKDVSRSFVNLSIWNDLNTVPLHMFTNVTPVYTDSINGFHIFVLDTPVIVSPGNLYVGWEQTGNFNLNIGLDRNYGYVAKKSGANPNIFYRVGEGNWIQNTDATINGAPMMRIYLGKPFNPAAGLDRTEINFARMYPNPFSNQLNIEMTGTFEYRLMDMNGRILLSGQGQDQVHLENLSLNPGVYWMICRNSNSNTVTQKLISF